MKRFALILILLSGCVQPARQSDDWRARAAAAYALSAERKPELTADDVQRIVEQAIAKQPTQVMPSPTPAAEQSLIISTPIPTAIMPGPGDIPAVAVGTAKATDKSAWDAQEKRISDLEAELAKVKAAKTETPKSSARSRGIEINWLTDTAQGRAKSTAVSRPAVVQFYLSQDCPPCEEFERYVLHDSEVIDELADWVCVRIDMLDENNADLCRRWNVTKAPTTFVLAFDWSERTRLMPTIDPQVFIRDLRGERAQWASKTAWRPMNTARQQNVVRNSGGSSGGASRVVYIQEPQPIYQPAYYQPSYSSYSPSYFGGGQRMVCGPSGCTLIGGW